MTLKRIARGTRRKIDVVLGMLQKLATDNMRVCQNPEGSTKKSTNQGAKNQSVAAGENHDPVRHLEKIERKTAAIGMVTCKGRQSSGRERN